MVDDEIQPGGRENSASKRVDLPQQTRWCVAPPRLLRKIMRWPWHREYHDRFTTLVRGPSYRKNNGRPQQARMSVNGSSVKVVDLFYLLFPRL